MSTSTPLGSSLSTQMRAYVACPQPWRELQEIVHSQSLFMSRHIEGWGMQGEQVLRRQTRLSFTACNLPLHQKADETCPFLEWVKSCSKVSTRSQFILQVPILNPFLNHKKHRVVVHHCSSKKTLPWVFSTTICYIHFCRFKNTSQCRGCLEMYQPSLRTKHVQERWRCNFFLRSGFLGL